MSRSRGGRSREEDDYAPRNPLPFAIPLQDNLARIHLEKLDLFGEIGKMSHTVDQTHKSTLTSVRPPTPKRSGGAFGNAKMPERRTRSVPSTLRKASPAAPEAVAEATKTDGVKSRGFVLPGNDPLTDYLNEHDGRCDAVKRAIQHQERMLAESRSRSASELVGNPKDSYTGSGQAFRWDRAPIGFALSESQAKLYPRSVQATRICGGGKNPRLTKPWQEYERWREAVWSDPTKGRQGSQWT